MKVPASQRLTARKAKRGSPTAMPMTCGERREASLATVATGTARSTKSGVSADRGWGRAVARK